MCGLVLESGDLNENQYPVGSIKILINDYLPIEAPSEVLFQQAVLDIIGCESHAVLFLGVAPIDRLRVRDTAVQKVKGLPPSALSIPLLTG